MVKIYSSRSHLSPDTSHTHTYVYIFMAFACVALNLSGALSPVIQVLCIQGFLTCRKHAESIILLVEMLQVM